MYDYPIFFDTVPEGEAESAFVRFSFPSIERLNAVTPNGDIFSSKEDAIRSLQELVGDLVFCS